MCAEYSIMMDPDDYEDTILRELAKTTGVKELMWGAADENWTDADIDMIEFSMEYPDVLFIMDVHEDTPEDAWRNYFKNGHGYAERIPQFPPFDESRLIDLTHYLEE